MKIERMIGGIPRLLLLGIAGSAALVNATRAHAHFAVCRSDPTITLSNGYQFTLWAEIQTDISQVTSVNYVLHIPRGLKVTDIQYDANGAVEHVQIVSDAVGLAHWVSTTAYTMTPNVPYTAYATQRNDTVASMTSVTGLAVVLQW